MIVVCQSVRTGIEHAEMNIVVYIVLPQAPLGHETLQARIPEWVAMPSSRGSS